MEFRFDDNYTFPSIINLSIFLNLKHSTVHKRRKK